jgi:hypothetical protein
MRLGIHCWMVFLFGNINLIKQKKKRKRSFFHQNIVCIKNINYIFDSNFIQKSEKMNANRRKSIEKLINQLTEIQSEIDCIRTDEQDYADNMPENLQDSTKHEQAESAIDALDEAYEAVQSVLDSLETAKE